MASRSDVTINFPEMQKLCIYNYKNINTLLASKTPYCQHGSKQGAIDVNKRICNFENCPYARKGNNNV